LAKIHISKFIFVVIILSRDDYERSFVLTIVCQHRRHNKNK